MLPAPEEISRDELITAMAGQLWELREANEVLAGTLIWVRPHR